MKWNWSWNAWYNLCNKNGRTSEMKSVIGSWGGKICEKLLWVSPSTLLQINSDMSVSRLSDKELSDMNEMYENFLF